MAMPVAIKRWTLEELHSLPDDGNTYELIHGELFVTPPPSDSHETIAARLNRLIDPYVAVNHLGLVYRPNAVFRVARNEVEPDLMVRALNMHPGRDWADAPVPILVVEISSPSTWRRDRQQKRDFYLNYGVAEYWIVDAGERQVLQIRPNTPDIANREVLRWHPTGAANPFVLDVSAIFDEKAPDTA